MEESQGISLKVKVVKTQLVYCKDDGDRLHCTGKKKAVYTGLF